MNVFLIYHYLRRQLRRERLFRGRLNPLDKFDDFELKKLFRFDRNNLTVLICSLEEYLQPRAYRNNPMMAAQKVCSCLNYLAGELMKELSQLYAEKTNLPYPETIG